MDRPADRKCVPHPCVRERESASASAHVCACMRARGNCASVQYRPQAREKLALEIGTRASRIAWSPKIWRDISLSRTVAPCGAPWFSKPFPNPPFSLPTHLVVFPPSLLFLCAGCVLLLFPVLLAVLCVLGGGVSCVGPQSPIRSRWRLRETMVCVAREFYLKNPNPPGAAHAT